MKDTNVMLMETTLWLKVESKEADIKSSVTLKGIGMYKVTYFAATVAKECEQFSMSVT